MVIVDVTQGKLDFCCRNKNNPSELRQVGGINMNECDVEESLRDA
jgi:hypothetical protein